VAMPTVSSQSVSPTSATSTPPVESPVGRAVSAYRRFAEAAAEAERHPRALGHGAAPSANFSRFSYDPFRTTFAEYVVSLREQGVAFRGVPSIPRVRVRSSNLNAKPYPTVHLTDCPTPSSSWQEFVVATGRVVPSTKPKVKPPYLISITMIRVGGRWGASRVSPDTSATCTA
jgi:hypothetical protein